MPEMQLVPTKIPSEYFLSKSQVRSGLAFQKRALDKSQMRITLREITGQPAGGEFNVLGEQPETVGAAHDVLEHLGQQGDYKTFFEEFSEWYRILKPGGILAGISPKWDGQWAWGDPGHTRVISEACFVYLQQPAYTQQVGKTAMTDYRFCYKADFNPVFYDYLDDTVFYYALQAVKPSRITL